MMIDCDGNSWEESSFYTLSGEQIKYMSETSYQSYQDIIKIFEDYNSGKVWNPSGKLYPISETNTDKPLVILEDLDSSKTLIRYVYLKENYYNSRYVSEFSRYIIDQEMSMMNSIRLPALMFNPTEVLFPFRMKYQEHQYSYELGIGCEQYDISKIMFLDRTSKGVLPKDIITDMCKFCPSQGLLSVHPGELFLKNSIIAELWKNHENLREEIFSKSTIVFPGILFNTFPGYRKIAMRHLKRGWRPEKLSEVFNFTHSLFL